MTIAPCPLPDRCLLLSFFEGEEDAGYLIVPIVSGWAGFLQAMLPSDYSMPLVEAVNRGTTVGEVRPQFRRYRMTWKVGERREP